ncbi:MAG: flagellin, partial [Roseicyclus sp.]
MVALQTLKSVNRSLVDTQSQISTGKSVASAKDNSAVWAISKAMDSDVKGFAAISESLALGESTVAVARNASETVTDLLTEIKGRVVAAQESNVDRRKIQTDIDELTSQIGTVVNAAQFNGLNLVKGTEEVDILASLDRGPDGGVSASNIAVARQDLTSDAGRVGSGVLAGTTADDYGTITDGTGAAATTLASADGSDNQAVLQFDGTPADGNVYEITIGGRTVSYTADVTGGDDNDTIRDALRGQLNALGIEGLTAADGANAGELDIRNTNAFSDIDISVTAPGSGGTLVIEQVNGVVDDVTSATIDQRAQSLDFSTSAGVVEGDSFSVTVGTNTFSYVAGDGENMEDVARGLKTAIDSNLPDGVSTSVSQDETTGQWSLSVDSTTGCEDFSLAVTTDGEASGGLF